MAETKQAASLMSIEELKQKLGVSDAVFEGTKAANGWKSGICSFYTFYKA